MFGDLHKRYLLVGGEDNPKTEEGSKLFVCRNFSPNPACPESWLVLSAGADISFIFGKQHLFLWVQ
jgi:hypothetical protein